MVYERLKDTEAFADARRYLIEYTEGTVTQACLKANTAQATPAGCGVCVGDVLRQAAHLQDTVFAHESMLYARTCMRTGLLPFPIARRGDLNVHNSEKSRYLHESVMV